MSTRGLIDRPPAGEDREFEVITEFIPGEVRLVSSTWPDGFRFYVQEKGPFGWTSPMTTLPGIGIRGRPTAVEAMAAYTGKKWRAFDVE